MLRFARRSHLRPLQGHSVLRVKNAGAALAVKRSSGFGGFAAVLALDDTGRLAAASAQVIELRAAHFALANLLQGIDERRVHRDHALDAFAVGDIADGEALVDA